MTSVVAPRPTSSSATQSLTSSQCQSQHPMHSLMQSRSTVPVLNSEKDPMDLSSRGPGIFTHQGQRLTTPTGRWVPLQSAPRLTNPILQLHERGVMCPTTPNHDPSMPPLPAANNPREAAVGKLVLRPFSGTPAAGAVKPRQLLPLDAVLNSFDAVARAVFKTESTPQLEEARVDLEVPMKTLLESANSIKYDTLWQHRILAKPLAPNDTATPHAVIPCPLGRTPLRQAAITFQALVGFRSSVREDGLKTDTWNGKALGTTQYCDVFNCTRSYRTGTDTVNAYIKNQTVVVAFEGRYYVVPFESQTGAPLSTSEVESLLAEITQGKVGGEVRTRDLSNLGALTALSREKCQSIVDAISASESNQRTVEAIKQAAFVLVLGAGDKPAGTSTIVAGTIAALDKGMPWLEKSLNVCILNDGTTTIRGDSALFDDVALYRLAMHVAGWTEVTSSRPTFSSLLEKAQYSPGRNGNAALPPQTAGNKQTTAPYQADHKVPPLPPPDAVDPTTRCTMWLPSNDLYAIQGAITQALAQPSQWQWYTGTVSSVRTSQILALQLDPQAFFHVAVQLAAYRATMGAAIPVVHETVTSQVYSYGRASTVCLATTSESAALLRAICDRKKASRPLSLKEVEGSIVRACAAELRVLQDAAVGASPIQMLMLLQQLKGSHAFFAPHTHYTELSKPQITTRCMDGFGTGVVVGTSPGAKTLHVEYRCRGPQYLVSLWGCDSDFLPTGFLEELSHAMRDLHGIVTSFRRHK